MGFPPAWRLCPAIRDPWIHGHGQGVQQTMLRRGEMGRYRIQGQPSPGAQPRARSQQRWLLTASASPGTMGRPCWIAWAHQPISRRTGAMRPSSQVRV